MKKIAQATYSRFPHWQISALIRSLCSSFSVHSVNSTIIGLRFLLRLPRPFQIFFYSTFEKSNRAKLSYSRIFRLINRIMLRRNFTSLLPPVPPPSLSSYTSSDSEIDYVFIATSFVRPLPPFQEQRPDYNPATKPRMNSCPCFRRGFPRGRK